MDINVYLQNNDYVRQLEAERDKALLREAQAVKQMQHLELECVNEKRVNLELIDTLKANGLHYRPSADMRTWEWSR